MTPKELEAIRERLYDGGTRVYGWDWDEVWEATAKDALALLAYVDELRVGRRHVLKVNQPMVDLLMATACPKCGHQRDRE